MSPCLRVLCPTSASLAVSLVNLEGEETFDAALLGSAEEVSQERICDDELILIKKQVIRLCMLTAF